MNPSKTKGPRQWVIYVLSDPRTPDIVRYVGATNNLKRRLKAHVYLSRVGKTRTHTGYWIQSLLRDGVGLSSRVVDSGEGVGREASEVRWISWHREQGFDLTNHTAGGEGSLGHETSAETRAKIRAAKVGKKLSPEHKAKISLGGVGRKPSSETVAKLSASKLGSTLSSETRAKISAAHTGKRQRPEAIAKTAAANRGQKRSPEVCRVLSEAAKESWKHRDRGVSLEARAKMSEAGKARWGRIRNEKVGGPHEG